MTGFEEKPLRAVILNWLYNDDLMVIMDASSELRKRFQKTFKRPDWAKGARDERTESGDIVNREL